MRNIYLVLVGLVVGTNVFASERWLCTDDSSQIQGSSILACGVGVGPDEAIARRQALSSAEQEFSVVCGPNTECGERKFSASPSRATCEQNSDSLIWKCYRLVVYRISEDKRVKTSSHDKKTHNFAVYANPVRDSEMDLIDEMLNKTIREQLR